MKEKSTQHGLKREATVSSMKVENYTVEFVVNMSLNNVFITDELIREKPDRVQNRNNMVVLSIKKTSLRFSRGWLYPFKVRNKFKC